MVCKVIVDHNHELTPQGMVHMIRKHRHMSDATKAHIGGLYGHGVPTNQERRGKIEDEDTNVVIGYLEGKAAVDPMAMAKYNWTEDGISKEGLSGCAHHLYASHLQKNVTSNGNEQLFHVLFSRWLYAEMEEEEFEVEWEQAAFEYSLENKIWAVQMYEKKHMWANAYMRGKFCL
ncbi:hypothetical protein PIB30_069977 [Stylosanthes scabra]|uniref:Protein FAR1-RELATED SEQUENCE n=1 Tax=Stylosanthes scabra TaxID=79078 RepID=A0ABU6VQ78_9FABA|nr:hypothetical protein [Stylosanthes scabra]